MVFELVNLDTLINCNYNEKYYVSSLIDIINDYEKPKQFEYKSLICEIIFHKSTGHFNGYIINFNKLYPIDDFEDAPTYFDFTYITDNKIGFDCGHDFDLKLFFNNKINVYNKYYEYDDSVTFKTPSFVEQVCKDIIDYLKAK